MMVCWVKDEDLAFEGNAIGMLIIMLTSHDK